LGWFDTGRVSALIAAFALVGIIYSVIAARAAKAQAVSSDKAATAAVRQAELAKDEVELGRQQIELLLRQIAQGEQAAQDTRRAQRDAMQPTVVVDIAPGLNDPGAGTDLILDDRTLTLIKVRCWPADLDDELRSALARLVASRLVVVSRTADRLALTEWIWRACP
jgi:type II secretory pathway pseudopilin PulG